MNYIDIVNSNYFKQTYSKIEELKKDFPVNHGFIHINNVINNCKRLAITFNLTAKETHLLLVAAALHDIGYLNGRDDHAYNGSILVKDVLKEWDFNTKDINIISNAIKNHGGKNESNYEDIISICLIISDKLDFIQTRYDKSKLTEEHLKTFPNITDTYLDYKNNQITLNIVVNTLFSVETFNSSDYVHKLNTFLDLLSKKLKCTYKINYIKK